MSQTITREQLTKLLRKSRRRRHGEDKYGRASREDRTWDGIVFDSKKEMGRYQVLKTLREAGEVLYFLRQVPFDLAPGARWRCDFYVLWADGTITIEDVKGYRTAEYRRIKKIVENMYPITITEI